VFKSDGDTGIMTRSPGGGDVVYGGTLQYTGAGKLVVKSGRQIYQDSIDTQLYLDLFDEIAVKSAYWARLQPNGVVKNALSHVDQNTIVFSSDGTSRCLQVFHVDRFDLYGVSGVLVEFDSSLEGKTILINVASTLNSNTGKKEVHIDNWANLFDTSGGSAYAFKSSTKASILWNFYDADVVTLGGLAGPQFPGTLLVPNGDLFFFWPGQDGRTIVGGDVWQERLGSEFHNYEFDPPCPLPLPPNIEIPDACIPTSAPIQITSAPVQPTSAPVQPTSAPVQPTSAPIQPTSAPIQPTSAPVQPTFAPVQPTSAPIETPQDDECVVCEDGYVLVRRAIRQEMADLCDPLDNPNEDVVYRFKVQYVNECQPRQAVPTPVPQIVRTSGRVGPS
jgi:choice-of-anchor A domain-containing protein